ncbi:HU domain-containing protein [Spirosoma pomorum]
MASVNEYLKKLLYQYDCVVVPDLGAFLTHYQPATFVEASGVFLPPRKRVAFNEALRLDDGILANYIMLHEPLTREGAQRHIGRFVDGLRQQIQEQGHFDLDGIGTFTYNEESRLQFEPSLRHNFFGDAYGMTALTARALVPQAIEPQLIEVAPTVALGPVRQLEHEPVFMPLPAARSYWRYAAAVLLIGSLGLVSYFSVIKPGQPLQSSVDPANLFRLPATWFASPAQQTTPAQTDVVPANNKVTAVTSESPEPVSPVEVTPTVVAPEPASVPSVQPTALSVPTPTPTETPAVAVRSTPHFTVIAGSFASKANAQRLKRQLRKAGYDDAFVIVPTQKGQLYKVAATGSPDRDVVIADLETISDITGTRAWIYTN